MGIVNSLIVFGLVIAAAVYLIVVFSRKATKF